MALLQFQIPLINSPQKFPIVIQGHSLTITCRWNAQGGFWKLDIADTNTETIILLGIPLYNGVDLLHQYPNSGIAGVWFITSATNEFDDPTYESLGVESFLNVEVDQ